MIDPQSVRARFTSRRFWRSSAVRITLIAWLGGWLLNTLVVLALYDFTLEALTRDLKQQIDRDITQRLDAWPSELPAHAGVTLWLYRHYAREIAEMEACLALYEADGELQLTNVEAGTSSMRLGPYFVASYTGHRFHANREAQQTQYCLVREQLLSDGGRLIYGLPFDAYMEPIEQLRRLRFWGLLITATFSLALAIFVSQRVLNGMRTITRAIDRIAQGDLKSRLTTRTNDSDFDHIAAGINHMLDRIEQLMGGVRDISDAIAHDLKTPLARLRGQLELLLNLPDRSDQAIEAVIAEADQVLAAFNALLRISQLEQGTRRRAFVHFNAESLVSQLRDAYELVLADKEIELQTALPAEELVMYGDRDLWLQALSNLLDNAYKYSPGGGVVRLAFARDQDHAVITVSDSGPGIPESERDNVLKRFYRLEKHRGTRGTGLGLTLVAAVCSIHNATIELGGEQGLTVTIRLPLGPQAVAPSQSVAITAE
ncbi:MAG: HAMP domain-containing sensor histidine kinase [Spongiibacteraceae bacterium]|nr:HAMP domain-containing sensor histidine kinase [Spongiibacteraceae bacterium]